MPDVIYKLTKPDLTTYNDYQWVVGEWRETDGTGGLCGPGWLHAYTSPLLAEFMNPIHANWEKYRLWRGEGTGARLDDKGLKVGYTKMRIIAELPLQTPTTEQRIRFAIGCAASTGIETDLPAWKSWAERWIVNNRADSRKVALAAKASASAAKVEAKASAKAWAAKVEAAASAAWAAWAWAAAEAAKASAASAASAAWAEAEAAKAAWAAAEAAEHDQTIDLEGIAQWAYTTEPLATLTRYIQEKK